MPPAAPTVKPFTTNCGALEDSGYNGPCEIITTPAGSIAAMVEIQQQGYSTNQSPAEERDLVYHRTAAGWSLALRRTETNNAASGTTQRATLWQSDINRDGDAKAVFVTPAPNPQFGEELDVVEATGQVIILRQLHGGFATVLPSGGLETLLPDPAEGYDQAVIKYSGGAWRIASVSHVSQAQAQSQGEQPFTDPQGSEANYSGHA